MQTNFSAAQLADPGIAEADRVIRSCVRHGFCPQTCPTYVLLGDENDSPRGRIDLMRKMLEQGGEPDAKAVRHIDQCLSCLACETTCAARVEYRHLLDRGRAYIETHFRRPLRQRLLRRFVAAVFPHPARLRVALWLARIGQPLAALLPRELASLLALVPPPPLAVASSSREQPPITATPQMRVALLAGCVQQVLGRHINEATVRVLQKHGCEVVLVGERSCCGALTLHMGREAESRSRGQQLISTLMAEIEGKGLDAIVLNIAGCGTTLKDYGHLFAGDPVWRERATQVAALVKDVSEVLDHIGFAPAVALPELPIAYHDACSLQHGQRVTAPPRRLLHKAGFRLREIPEAHFCCGSAGTYNLLQPALAEQLGARKASAAKATGAVAVAAGNLGCMVQIAHHSGLPLVHTIELLDWASGGPQPAALAQLDLGQFPPRATAVASPAPANSDEINYWVYDA